MPRRTSAGVIVTDGRVVLLGHATRSPRWDIPKGVVEPGETVREAALRELAEETGLTAPANELIELGTHAYLPAKDLALFAWRPAAMPDPSRLACGATFALPSGAVLPEFDRFGLFPWDAALARVGRNLARVLGAIRAELMRGVVATSGRSSGGR
jgi:8-oxo-dGTP pyrophosphatase MutT (NUDIX family)